MASDLSFNITALDNASKTFVKMASQVERLSKKVDELDRKDASVNVDADTAKANASLDRTESKADDLDGKEADIRVNVKGAAAALAKVAGVTAASNAMSRGMTAAASSSTMLVAALPVVSAAAVSAAGAIGALASAASVAGTGMAAFGTAAVGNIKKVTDVSDKIESLNEQLKRTGTSTHAVAQAQRAHSRAVQQAAWSAADAARNVEDAERSLTRAQRDARMAQQALTQARDDAARSMEQLRFAVAGGAIAERQAVLDLRDAREELSNARQAEKTDGSEAAAERLAEAQVAYDRQELSLRKIRARNKELAEQQAEATRQGIEGSDQVVAAKQRILDANRRVADAERALADARRTAARQQVRSQQAIADAALAVQRAQEQAGKQQAELIAERTRLINSLTPAQNELRKAIDGVSQAYQDFLAVTAQPVAKALTPWLEAVNPLLKALQPIVTEVADAIAVLGNTVRADIEDGFIGGFLKFLEGKVGGAVQQFGTIFLRMFRGITGVIKAFWPLGKDLLTWLTGLMDRFARWANSPEGHKDMEGFFQLVRDAGPKVWEAIKNAAKGIGKLMASFTGDGISMLGIVSDFFEWMSKGDNANRVKMALYGIAAAMTAIAVKVTVATGGLNLIIPIIGALVGYYFPEISKAAKAVGGWFNEVFTEKIPNAWHAFIAYIKMRWEKFKNFWTETVPNAFQWVWDQIVRGWNTFKNFWIDSWNDLKNTVSDFASDLWDDVVSTFKDGVNAVTGFLNKWFIKPLNKLLGVFNLEIPLIPKLETGGKLGKDIDQLASGGRVGSGFKTSGPTAIVGEGNPRYPEYVIPTDPKYRSNARNLHAQAGSQLEAGGVLAPRKMAEGGILDWLGGLAGGAWEGIKNIGEGIAWLGKKSWNLIKRGAGWLMDNSVKPIVDKVKSILPENLIGDMARGTIDKMYGGIRGFLEVKEKEVSDAANKMRQDRTASGRPASNRTAGSRPAGQWGDVVNQALSMLGMPQHWADEALRQIQIESGGNPNAVNRWDINAQRGTPSMGLLQTIGPTFQAYKLPGHNNILSPLDNVLAALRYTVSRYGSVPNIWPTRAGYESGSWSVPRTESALVHKGEMIIPADLASAVRSGMSGGQQPLIGSLTVNAGSNAGPDEIAGATMFEVRKVRQGGVYSS